MKISVVIPNWNGEEKLKRNLPKVLEAARINGVQEVIVTDDASTDKSVAVLKTQFPEVKVIESNLNKNRGFGSNVNIGVSCADGDLIFLLNSDATPDKDFIKFALPHFEDSKVFSVGCNTGGLWSGAKFEDGFFWHGQADPAMVDGSCAHQTLWSSGGSAFFRKALWDEMGGLDPLYDPFYVEDLDLGYRATKRGYINIWEPKSLVEHYKEKGVIESNFSKALVNNTAERNILIFIWKNITSPQLIRAHQQALIKRLLMHPKYFPIFLEAIKKWPKIMEERKLEEEKAKFSDDEILSKFSEGMLYSK